MGANAQAVNSSEQRQPGDEEWWGSDDDEMGGGIVQPWARKEGDAPRPQQAPKGTEGTGQQPQQQQPVEVACVGMPFCRFIRTESAKNTAAAAPGAACFDSVWWFIAS